MFLCCFAQKNKNFSKKIGNLLPQMHITKLTAVYIKEVQQSLGIQIGQINKCPII